MSDPLALRLGDLAPNQSIRVRCTCGKVTELPHGFLQRRHRLPSSVLVFDLQFKLRCEKCRSKGPFRISILDRRGRGGSRPMEESIVVPGWADVIPIAQND